MKRVLIVEDNPINRELLEYLLRAHGFETSSADGGREGLEIARRVRPDVVLCDIQMPDMDGYEFARQAKADPSLATVPLIAVTAFAMVGDRERILARQFDGYIAKPIDAEALLAAIGGSLSRRPAGPVAEACELAAPAASATILVVDDSPMNLQLKRSLLEPHGYRIRTADRGDEALRAALAEPPSLIISDVGMAEGSGFDFIRAVKAEPALAAVPFIFVSATHWDSIAETTALRLGAVRYLRRPLEPQLLLAEVRKWLGG